MKKITIALITSATILAAGAGTVYAFGGHGGFGGKWGGMMHHGPMHLFNKADANKDGVVTRQEAMQMRANRFDKFDADKNGTVTIDELDAGIEKRLARLKAKIRYGILARFDRDGNGEITAAEFKNHPIRIFDHADANGDGKVTRAEAAQMRHRIKGRFMRHLRAMTGPYGPMHDGTNPQ